MTVSTLEFYKVYVATAAQTVFPYPFKILAAADLRLYDDGTLQVLGVDYTVSGVGVINGGNVTFLTGRTAGHTILIRRETPRTQATALTAGQRYSEDQVEAMADKLTLIEQENPATVIPLSPVGYYLRTKADSSGIEAVASMALGTAMPFDSGTGAPTTGTWATGHFRFNSLPVRGGPDGWKCILGGTPGTWIPIGKTYVVNVDDYGAVGDGVTDDYAAITAAIAATPAGGVLKMYDKEYYCATTVTVDKNISFLMEGDASIKSDVAGIALNFTASLQRVRLRLSVNRSAIDWTAGNVGIQILDMIDCEVWVDRVTNFEKGLYIYCTSGTVYFNKIFLGQIYRNQYGVRIEATTGNINANRFYAGRWSVDVTDQPTLARYGIFIEKAGTNIFYSPGIEVLPGNAGGTSYAAYFKGVTRQNRIIDPYIEGETYVMGVEGEARYNKIIGLFSDSSGSHPDAKIYEAPGVTFPGTNIIDWTVNDNVSLSKGGLKNIFPVTDVTRALVESLSGAYREYVVPGFTWCSRGAGAYTHKVGAATISLGESCLRVNGDYALGRKVDTSTVKNFRLAVEQVNTDTMRAVVVAYDAAGARLHSGTHVQGDSMNTDDTYVFAATADFGNAYLCDYIAGSREVFFNVAAAVKSIWVGVIAGPADVIEITGISLKTDADRTPPSWAGYDLVTNGAYAEPGSDLVAAGAPIGGVFNNGTRIRHMDAATGEAPDWSATGRVTTAANGGEPAAETVVAVDDITGITDLDKMGVIITEDVTLIKRWWWTSVNGAPAAGNVTMAHAVPAGFTIADGAKVITWRLLALPALP